MTTYKFINFFRSELAQGITSISNVMLIPQIDAVKLPSLADGEAIRMAIWDGQQEPEIVDVTQNLATGQLPILRAKEDTTAKNWPAGTQVTAIISAEMLTSFMASFFNVDLLLESNFLKLTGGTMSGKIKAAVPPTDPEDLVNKEYADTITGDFLPRTGGVMAGDIDMVNAYQLLRVPSPDLPDHGANKKYVDDVQAISAQRDADDSGFTVTAGGPVAFTVTSSFPWAALVEGIVLTMRFNSANGKDATLNLNNLGAKQIAGFGGQNIAEAAIQPNVPIRLTFVASTDKWHVHDYYPNDWWPGDVKYSGQTADHGPWLLCDGRLLNRTVHSRLYNAIGTWYGAGDGSTTFAIPDLRGRVAVGKDNMGGTGANRVTFAGSLVDGSTLGGYGGFEKITLTDVQLPAHTHPINDPNHFHQFAHTAITSITPPTNNIGAGTSVHGETVNSNTNEASTGITVLPNTGGQAHNNMPPSLIFNAFIHI